MSTKSKLYLIVSLIHLAIVVLWVALLQDTTSGPGFLVLQTIFFSHCCYWFYSIFFQFTIDYYERRNKNFALFMIWAMILLFIVAAAGFGITGFIKSIIEFKNAEDIRITIPLFVSYGLIQLVKDSVFS